MAMVGRALDVLLEQAHGRWILRWMEETDTDIACFRDREHARHSYNQPKIAREFLMKQDATFALRPISMVARRQMATT
ncbi:hypothetical protein NL676_019659 [Syzygium grande]|nr:hypothetical protein NL676_019659 [Syzygium grande]